MAKFLVWFAAVALVMTFLTTWAAILLEWRSAGQFLDLTRAILSWKVIAGGLVIGARSEITGLLGRLAT